MRLKYDLNVGALYIRLTDQAVARTQEIDDNTFVNVDAAGEVVGVEVISIEHLWAIDQLLHDYNLPHNEAAQLRAYFEPAGPGSTPAVSMRRNAPACVAA